MTVEAQRLLVKANLKQLRLPTMHAEFEKLAREAAAANEEYEQYLLFRVSADPNHAWALPWLRRVVCQRFPEDNLVKQTWCWLRASRFFPVGVRWVVQNDHPFGPFTRYSIVGFRLSKSATAISSSG